jgi:hypothetical protein
MEFRTRTQPEEWACTKFCRTALDDDSVEHFFLWLCDHTPEQLEAWVTAHKTGEAVWYDPVESAWGWDAPRQRLARLLWQLLHGNASAEDFRRRFTFATGLEAFDSASLLAPMQEKLRWVMEGLANRQKEDDQLGQTDWGEYWWLPPEQTEFVRQQLKDTHAELIERSSDYEEAVCSGLSYYVRYTVQAIAVPSNDPARVYIGKRRGPHGRVFVWVKDSKGDKHPLQHGDTPYCEADGTGFEWGYGGHGPGALSICILIDALDGDLTLANELTEAFYDKFILHHPRTKDLKLSRTTVLRWLKEVGKLTLYEQRRPSVSESLSAHAKVVTEREQLIRIIQQAGGLCSQRFDIVPDSFEAALYLDLMQMLEKGGAALRCTHCRLPIPYDQTGRANRQRARSRNGEPIYHPECFVEVSRQRKRTYWQRRAKSPQFREQQRARGREYRKTSVNRSKS